MTRVFNFSPGPATLPTEVLESVQAELLDYESSGISMLEHSHRGAQYSAVHAEAKALFKELLAIPDTHEVLFMQGGASGQNALLPMNFLPEGKSADYVDTGTWSVKSFKAANKLAKARWAGSGKAGDRYVKAPLDLELDNDAAYVHITSNSTIMGTQYHEYPATQAPLVADMSSDLLWRPLDVSKFGLIYAGAQKNVGPAGVTIVIADKSFIASARDEVPNIWSYKFFLEKDSLGNTAPTFPIYVVSRVLRWVKDNGGAAGMQARNQKKADTLYGVIDGAPDFFRTPIEKASRSVMNVVCNLPNADLEKKFVADAAAAGLVNTKGHRSVGGLRLSIYNAMSQEGVDKLAQFMTDFQKANA